MLSELFSDIQAGTPLAEIPRSAHGKPGREVIKLFHAQIS